MIAEYIQTALNRAHYEIIEDEEPFFGEVRELPGVYATGITLEECRRNLADVIEGWLIVSIRRDIQIPSLGGLTIDVQHGASV